MATETPPNQNDYTAAQKSARRRVEAHAHALLADLLRIELDGYPAMEVMALSTGRVRVEIRVRPDDELRLQSEAEAARWLSPCEADMLDIVEASVVPITRPRIFDELARRGILHGESTVAHALADLVKMGLLINQRKPPRGYIPGVMEEEEGSNDKLATGPDES